MSASTTLRSLPALDGRLIGHDGGPILHAGENVLEVELWNAAASSRSVLAVRALESKETVW